MIPNDKVTLDIKGRPYDFLPRFLWQNLFNIYRDYGCPLDDLLSLLVDLRNCEQAVENGGIYYFEFNRHDSLTYWRLGNYYSEAFPPAISCNDIIIKIEIQNESISLTRIK